MIIHGYNEYGQYYILDYNIIPDIELLKEAIRDDVILTFRLYRYGYCELSIESLDSSQSYGFSKSMPDIKRIKRMLFDEFKR